MHGSLKSNIGKSFYFMTAITQGVNANLSCGQLTQIQDTTREVFTLWVVKVNPQTKGLLEA